MKKSILNIGKALNKAEQKSINGGLGDVLCSINCFPQGRLCYMNNVQFYKECD